MVSYNAGDVGRCLEEKGFRVVLSDADDLTVVYRTSEGFVDSEKFQKISVEDFSTAEETATYISRSIKKHVVLVKRRAMHFDIALKKISPDGIMEVCIVPGVIYTPSKLK